MCKNHLVIFINHSVIYRKHRVIREYDIGAWNNGTGSLENRIRLFEIESLEENEVADNLFLNCAKSAGGTRSIR